MSGEAFDPNRFIAETSAMKSAKKQSTVFDPAKFIKETKNVAPAEGNMDVVAPLAVRRYGRAISGGLTDTLAGAKLALEENFSNLAIPESERPLPTTVGEQAAKFRAETEAMGESAPSANIPIINKKIGPGGVAEFAGYATPQGLYGALGRLGKATNLAAGSGKWLGRAVQAGVYGAGAGAEKAAEGVLEGRPLGTIAGEVGTAAGIGAGGSFAADIGAEKAAHLATRTGVNALGFLKTQLKNVGGLNRAKKAVDVLIDKTSVIRPWKSATAMERDLITVKNESGEVISGVLEKLDKAGGTTLDPAQIYTNVANTVVKKYGKTLNKIAGDVPEISKELTVLGDRLGSINGNATFKELQYQKQLIGDSINWKESGVGDLGNEAKKIMYYAVSDAIDSGLDGVIGKMGDANMRISFGMAKELYSAASTGLAGVKQQLSRDAANKYLGITDWMLLGGGLGAGAFQMPKITMATVVALAAKKVGEKYGAQLVSNLSQMAAASLKRPEVVSPIIGMGAR